MTDLEKLILFHIRPRWLAWPLSAQACNTGQAAS